MNEELIMAMFKKVETSGRNVRILTAVLAISCIITSITAWNSFSESWLANRIELHENQVYWLEFIKTNSIPPNLQPAELAIYLDAKEYYDSKRYNEKILMANLLSLKNIHNNEVIFVNTPYYGIKFDVNDLGLISGLTFSFILLFLAYALVVKRNHLVTAFATIERLPDQNTVILAYELIRMDQTLTVTNTNEAINKLRWITKSLYVLPFVIHSVILYNDIRTFRSGSIVHLGNTILQYAYTGIFEILILALTLACYYAVYQTDNVWRIHN